MVVLDLNWLSLFQQSHTTIGTMMKNTTTLRPSRCRHVLSIMTSLRVPIHNFFRMQQRLRILPEVAHLRLPTWIRRWKEDHCHYANQEAMGVLEEEMGGTAAQNAERASHFVMAILKKTRTTVPHAPGGSSLTPTPLVIETRRKALDLRVMSTRQTMGAMDRRTSPRVLR